MRRWTKQDWREIGAFYGTIFAITGVPRMIDPLVDWLSCMVGFLALSNAVVLLWAVAVFPIALLFGKIFGGSEHIVTNRDPDGPGFVV